MKYRVILKDPSKQPLSGTYSDWKVQIADECYKQCVYCTIGEGVWGGIDHYHIDHYKPKSLPQFKPLVNDICNLFYACPICNRFKSDDWPSDPIDLNTISYPDPSKVDYSTIFQLDKRRYILKSPYKAGIYLIERLFLNRPQLIYHRREQYLNRMYNGLMDEIPGLLSKLSVTSRDEVELIMAYVTLSTDLSKHLLRREDIRPYKLTEIRKS